MCLQSGTMWNCDKTGALAEDDLPFFFKMACTFSFYVLDPPGVDNADQW